MSVSPSPLGSLLPVSPDAVVMQLPNVEDSRVVTLSDRDSHLFVGVGEGKRAHVVVHLDHVEKFGMEIVLASSSHLTVVCIDTSDASLHVRQRTQIGDGAQLKILNVTLGTDTTHELVSTAVGHNAVSSIDWLAYAKKTEKQLLTVRNVFNATNGGGEVTMRGVAEGKASINVKGLIEIGEHGGGTNTYLTQQVLMLDTTAKVDAQPALEIKTNDVKASHSATVSRVTPEDLYYFGARGVDPTVARGLFVQGFLGELVHRLELPEAETILLEAIERKYRAK